jgi:hypothetical protein
VIVGALCPVGKAGSNKVGEFSGTGALACGATEVFVMVFRPVTGSVMMWIGAAEIPMLVRTGAD